MARSGAVMVYQREPLGMGLRVEGRKALVHPVGIDVQHAVGPGLVQAGVAGVGQAGLHHHRHARVQGHMLCAVAVHRLACVHRAERVFRMGVGLVAVAHLRTGAQLQVW